MKDRLDWSSVVLISVCVVCGTVAASLLFWRDPGLVERLDWGTIGIGAAAAFSGLVQMMRAAGLWKNAAALLLAAGIGAATLSGCGASALTSHATAATVLTVATAGASELAVESVQMALDQCSDEPCIARVEEAGRVVTVAQEGLRLATLTYREAVEVAAAAESGDDLLSALVAALARVVREWDALVAVLREQLSADLPMLPASVRAMVDALAGGGS